VADPLGKDVGPEVETQSGRIRGLESRGIRVFRGVPFARPPLGTGRFQPPQPPEPWAGTRPAPRAGDVAYQARKPVFSYLNTGGARQSEDCLNLNVWTPGLDGRKRPVLVWIHGGGFLIGSGSTRIYDGHSLARRGDLVVVTINYRLGAFGFLHLNGIGGDAFRHASNAGLRDQVAALEWIRDNIERFGGDPDNVTVFGQSAGAMSIGGLLGAPRARALFHRGILQSGATHNVLSQEQADRIAHAFLGELGGPPCDGKALARVPVLRLQKAQNAVIRAHANLETLMVFQPAVDGDLIPEPPLDAIRKGAAAHIPLLIGTTLDEWKLFTALDSRLPRMPEHAVIQRFEQLLPRAFHNAPDAPAAARAYREAVRARGGRTTSFEIWSAFQSTRIFHHPAIRLAEAQAQAGGSAHAYLFTWRPPALRRTLGACHAIDLPFVFGLSHLPVARPFAGLTSPATRLSRQMQHAWSDFARVGDPGHRRLPSWDAYGETRSTMIFGRDCYVADAPLEPERLLWERWEARSAH